MTGGMGELVAHRRYPPVRRLRASVNDNLEKEEKISVNDFIIKASSKALLDVPQANSAWFDDRVRVYKRADVSMAVSTDKGLITPIIFGADSKSLRTIAMEAKVLGRMPCPSGGRVPWLIRAQSTRRAAGSLNESSRQQAQARGVPGWHLHGLQPGHVWD